MSLAPNYWPQLKLIFNTPELKAFWSIQSSISNVPGDAFKKLFESLVASVLDYGAPLWAHSIPRSNTVERLQQHAYRCFLGVGRKHAAAASAGDMCWRYVLDANISQRPTPLYNDVDIYNENGQ